MHVEVFGVYLYFIIVSHSKTMVANVTPIFIKYYLLHILPFHDTIYII